MRYASPFNHASEQRRARLLPRALLDASQTDVELTAATRAAMQRYTFPPAPTAQRDHGRRAQRRGRARRRRCESTRRRARSRARRAAATRCFFVARFERPFAGSRRRRTGAGGWVELRPTGDRAGDDARRASRSSTSPARGATSTPRRPRSTSTRMRARRARRVERASSRASSVDGGSAARPARVHTALYHSLLHPNVFTDVDGRYRGFDDAIHAPTGASQYANFSSWDTYKAQNQLLALIAARALPRHAARRCSPTRSRAASCRAGASRTSTPAHMSGDPAIPMIADGVLPRAARRRRRARRSTTRRVELRTRRPAELDAARLPARPRPGTTLEYGVADFALALVADRLGHAEDAQRCSPQSLRYRNLLDPETKWIRPRHADGSLARARSDPTRRDRLPGGQLLAVLVARAARRARPVRPHGRRRGGRATRFDHLLRAARPRSRTGATLFGIVYRPTQYAPGNEHDLQAPWMPAVRRAAVEGRPSSRDVQHAVPRRRSTGCPATTTSARCRPGTSGRRSGSGRSRRRAVLRRRLAGRSTACTLPLENGPPSPSPRRRLGRRRTCSRPGSTARRWTARGCSSTRSATAARSSSSSG